MRVLVTGVYGFIGSHFVQMVLRQTNWQVVGFGRMGSEKNQSRLRFERSDSEGGSRRQLIEGDLTNASALSGICEDIDYVVNFAAKTFVDHAILDPRPFVDSNIVGTYNLLEQARKYKVKRFIQISTDEVYGAILEGAYKEDARLNPTNPYSATKAAGDMLALSYFNTYKLPVVITRTENNYGPYQHRQKVLPTFVRKALAGEKLPVYGDGQHRRMWLHVNDHCRAVLMLLEKGRPGEIYHVAGSQELANIELARLVLSSLGRDSGAEQIELVPDAGIRPGHDRRYALDTTKIRTGIGWAAEVGLQEGITETVKWYERNSWWLE